MAKRKVMFLHGGLAQDFKIPLSAIPYDCSCTFLTDHEQILESLGRNRYKLAICSLKYFKSLPESVLNNPRFLLIPKIFFAGNNSVRSQKESISLGAVDYLPYPFDPMLLTQKITRALELESYRGGIESVLKEQFRRLEGLHSGIIMMLANIVESRDGTTGEHVKHVSHYVKALASRMKENSLYTQELREHVIEHLIDAAALHDIGKITVPDSILKKGGKLSEAEYELMKNHSKEGGLLIKRNLKFLKEDEFVKIASDIASYHHEKWDGSGYPFGKKGKNIPLVARITAVADVFDALVSKRQYKEAMSVDEALEIMKKEEGKAFEPAILKVFLSMSSELKVLIRKLSNKTIL